MESTGMNYLAVLVAGVAHMVLGALWYSPVLFGNAWMNAIGKTKEQVAADFTPMNYVYGLVGSLLSAYGIARILSWTSLEPLWGGTFIGLLAGVCFVAATSGVNDAFEGRPFKLYFMNALYYVIGFVVMGIIIGAWR